MNSKRKQEVEESEWAPRGGPLPLILKSSYMPFLTGGFWSFYTHSAYADERPLAHLLQQPNKNNCLLLQLFKWQLFNGQVAL